MQTGIYKIESTTNPNRIYIGSAVNISKRWRHHLRRLEISKHHSLKLQRHYDKYGKDDLIFSIVETCEKEDLLKTEQGFLDSCLPYFNNCKNAGSMLGFKFSEESKQRLSEAHSGIKNWNYGRHIPDEQKKKISIANTGRKRSAEALKKMSESQKGRHHSEEAKKKISEATKRLKTGTHHSEESKKKMSESQTGRIHSEATKDKIRAASLLHRHSDESKKKISLAKIGKPSSRKGCHLTDETKDKIRKAHLGTHPSEETRKKMSESGKRRQELKRSFDCRNNKVGEESPSPEYLVRLSLGFSTTEITQSCMNPLAFSPMS